MRSLPKLELGRPPTADARVKEMEAFVRASAENRPAVYRMIAVDGEVVYVGKSKQLRSRLLSYSRGSYPEDKGARILRDADRIDWEYVPSEFAALLAELRQIKQHRPRRNVAMKRDGRNLCFINSRRSGAAAHRSARSRYRRHGAYYGPSSAPSRRDPAGTVRTSRHARLHARRKMRSRIRRSFTLPPANPAACGTSEEVPGPCIAACSSGEYMTAFASRARS